MLSGWCDWIAPPFVFLVTIAEGELQKMTTFAEAFKTLRKDD